MLIITFKEDEHSEFFFTVAKDDDKGEKKPKTRNLKKENKENKEKKEEDVNTNIGENTSLLTNDLIINIITIIIIILLICLFFISLLQTKNRNLKIIPDNTPMKKLKLVNIILSKLN